MLHILLLILKIIGIILAAILGIIIVLLGILLFVPIRYEVSAKCDGNIDTLKAKGKVTWFLHLVRADVFAKGKMLKWKLRLAWFKRTNTATTDAKWKEEKKNEKVEEKSSTVQNIEKCPEVSDKGCEENPGVHRERRETCKKDDIRKDLSKKTIIDSETKEKADNNKKKKKIPKEKLIDKIKRKVQSVINRIKDLLQKKEKLIDLITDKVHVNAFKKVKKELFILLRKLKPKKLNIKVRYGFEDPYTTGQMLAGLSMLYPFLGETVEIIPDFENQVLKGTVYFKGRIRLSHFAGLAWRLFWCKDVRTAYKDIRNFKL